MILSFFFFTPYLHKGKTKLKAAHWPAWERPLFASLWPMKRIQRRETTINQERRGDRGKELRRCFNGAFSGQVTGLATVVAVDLRRLAALHGHMTDLATPVTLDLVT